MNNECVNVGRFRIGHIFIGAILAMAVLAGCAPAAGSGSYSPSYGAPAQAPTVAATNVPSSAPTSAPAAATAPAAAPAAVALKLSQNSALGSFLTDGQGRTLYVFLKDTMNTSNCNGGCAQTWPPLTAQAKPSVGDGLKADLVGTIQRQDGSMQVTYNGHPLYHYAPDQKPGDTNGQGIGGVWFVVTAEGNPMNGAAAPGAAAPAGAPTQAPSNPYNYP